MTFSRTEEQQNCIDLAKQPGHLKINAYAGSGKTTTCLELAKEVRMPMLYLCFNKAIADEAATKFPDHVVCSTQHSFAYRAVARTFNNNRDKLTKSIYARDTATVLGLKNTHVFGGTAIVDSSVLGYCVNQTVRRYCQSGDVDIANKHYVPAEAFENYTGDDRNRLREIVVTAARSLWSMMCDPSSPVPLGFDGYVKYWERNNPVINTGKILLDEAQDTNGVMLSILEQQKNAEIIFVGDRYQQIYEWRGAVNAMELFPNARNAYLTQSFRFGQETADFASDILRLIGDGAQRIRGNPNRNSRVTYGDQSPPVRLARTNATIMSALVEAYMDDEDSRSIYVNGGVNDLIALIDGAWDLQQGKRPKHNLFMGFKDWGEFEAYCEKTKDGEATAIRRIMENHGPQKAKRSLQNVVRDAKDADVILTTAHKSKGQEWSAVQLETDYRPLVDDEGNVNEAEARLVYVAVTRGIDHTNVPAYMWAEITGNDLPETGASDK